MYERGFQMEAADRELKHLRLRSGAFSVQQTPCHEASVEER